MLFGKKEKEKLSLYKVFGLNMRILLQTYEEMYKNLWIIYFHMNFLKLKNQYYHLIIYSVLEINSK
jgi:hypothetical protein